MSSSELTGFPRVHSFVENEDRGSIETDSRWVAIDKYTTSHLHPSSRPTHAILEAAAAHALASGLPDIASPPAVGKFLALQAKLVQATHVLEVGLLGGYSALWLLLSNPQIRKLVTLEIDPDCARVAKENFDKAGIDPSRYEIILGPAVDNIPQLHADILAGRRERFSFSFIDADKPNNWTYMDWAVKMSYTGDTHRRSCIVVDNVVSKGRLADPSAAANGDNMVAGGRKVVEMAGKDDRVEATVLQIVGEKDYDGFLFAVVK